MGVNILWLASVSKAFYRVVAKLGEVAQLCVFTFTLVYLSVCLGMGVRYTCTYSSFSTDLAEDPVRREVHHQVGQHAEDPHAQVRRRQVGEEEVGDGAHLAVTQNDENHQDIA